MPPSMTYVASHPLAIEPETVLQRAKMLLAMRGFATAVNGRRLLAQGPQLSSPSQDPLGGAGKLVLDLSAELSVRLEADLSGLRALSGLVLAFPPLACVALAFIAGPPGVTVWRPALINAVVWLILGPLIVGWLHRRTRRALDSFLRKVSTG